MRTAAQISVAGSVTEVFAAASRRLHELVPHDAAAWVMIDPATGFPSAPSLQDARTMTLPPASALLRLTWLDFASSGDGAKSNQLMRSESLSLP
jgi:hypothetical protein